MFANLLNNAARYTDRGGQVRVEVRIDGDTAEATVSDNGMGIPAEALPGLFEMFSQVEVAPSRQRGGLGFGLTLVKQLLELHGGQIEARSAGLGEGAAFVARLPLVGAETAPPAPEHGSGTTFAVADSVRILVADDNRDTVESMRELLAERGHEVRTAHDGHAAVEVAERFRPELILMDIGMPGSDGYEAARQIRATPWGRSAVLVAVTGWGNEADRRRAADVGFDQHFTKPIRLDEIGALLDAVIARRRPEAAPARSE